MVAPIKLISDQGTHFLNKVIKKMTGHYMVLHKKSSPYHLQVNGLVESSNKIIVQILTKLVILNRTYWDEKPISASWVYRTSFKVALV